MQTHRVNLSFERETEESKKVRQLARRTIGVVTPRPVFETVPASVLITINLDGIARELGRKAMANKAHIAREIGGLVTVEWRAAS